MKYFKTKDSHMAVTKVNDVEFCTHITANGVNWVLFSLVNHNAVECEKKRGIGCVDKIYIQYDI